MKKILISAAMAAMCGAVVPAAQAATSGPTAFTVSATLTSSCTFSTPATVVFAYTSFQAGAQAATGGGFNVTCTTSLPYTFGITLNNSTLVGLNYTLGTSVAGGTGSGVAQAYNVTGNMVASQAGTCATAGGSCTASNATNTLTLTY